MNVYLQEIRFHKKSLLIWNISLFTILVMMLLIYPAVMSEGEAYFKILETMPTDLLEAVSIDFDTFLSYNGFFAYFYNYLLIALCVLAMNLGLSALGKEISGKTADFILTKPFTRSSLLTEKILAAFTVLLLTNVFLGATTLLMNLLLTKEDRNLRVLFLIFLAGFILQVLFYTLGVFIGILRKRIRFVISTSLSTVFMFFILSILSQLLKKDFLNYITPFRYFNFNSIIATSGYDPTYLAISLILIALLTALSYIVFKKKEIHT